MLETQGATLIWLVRAELAAADAFETAVKRFSAGPLADELRQIQAEHREAANVLRQHLRLHGAEPDEALAQADDVLVVAETDSGNEPLSMSEIARTLEALRETELDAAVDYREAADSEGLPVETRSLISSMLLPQMEAHVAMLDRLLSA